MARGRKKAISGEILPPDFDGAHSVYVNDVQPANKEQKRAMKEASSAWKAIKGEHHVNVGGYRTAMKVAEMEEAEQQSWLRSFYGGLKKRGAGLHADLADQMEEGGETDEDGFIPFPKIEPASVDFAALNS